MSSLHTELESRFHIENADPEREAEGWGHDEIADVAFDVVREWLAGNAKQVGFVHESGKVVDLTALSAIDVTARTLLTQNRAWRPVFLLPEEAWPSGKAPGC